MPHFIKRSAETDKGGHIVWAAELHWIKRWHHSTSLNIESLAFVVNYIWGKLNEIKKINVAMRWRSQHNTKEYKN